MKKLSKSDFLRIGFLMLAILFMIAFITKGKFLYGSTTDWQNQHWAFPDYFRSKFYDTHDLFPDFAMNIGGGQNIYNFSYYGFLSPIVLVSYLFPFVPMYIYIMVTSILILLASIVLVYIWLHNHDYSSKVCFYSTLLFAFATPLSFHSHRHIMFMNYMPFLILALMGIDALYKKNKSTMLVISSFLIIMTSYYYSIPSLIVLYFYWIYLNINDSKISTFKKFITLSLKCISRLIISVFMSGILLIPTFIALLSSSRGNGAFKTKLLTPTIQLINSIHNSYGLGLITFAIFIVFSRLLAKNKGDRFLSCIFIIFTSCPFILYILNGTIYARAKVLIPFLPLFGLLSANFFKDFIEDGKINKISLFFYGLVCILNLFVKKEDYFNLLAFIDCSVTIVIILIYMKVKIKNIILVTVSTISFLCFMVGNIYDELLPIKDLETAQDTNTTALINKELKNDDDFYRVCDMSAPFMNVNRVTNDNIRLSTCYSSIYNKNYQNFYYNVMNNEIMYNDSVIHNTTHNILSNMFMGNKYILSKKCPGEGYEEVKKYKDKKLYRNNNVLPVGFANSHVMDENEYKTLKYPENAYACLSNIIPSDSDFKADMPYSRYSTKFTKENIDIDNIEKNNVKFTPYNNTFYVNADLNAKIKIPLKESLKDRILFIEFDVTTTFINNSDSKFIKINGIKNKQTPDHILYSNHNHTFSYVISDRSDIDDLNIEIKKGFYIISNIRCYSIDKSKLLDYKSSITPLDIDRKTTKGDTISGKINVPESQYFMFTIPYDKGFDIKVNGKQVKYTEVNNSFIGFPINAGENKISLTFHCPYKKIAIAFSITGFILLIGLFIYEKKINKANK